MNRISPQIVESIISLRKKGYSIPEIHQSTGIAKTTVQRYVKGIKVPDKFLSLLREKQGGSRARAIARKETGLSSAHELLSTLSIRDRFFLLVGLYWGEGAKKDFSIINSDPALIRTFIDCLYDMGIEANRLSVSLRVHKDISIDQSVAFWSVVTGISRKEIRCTEIIEGRKKGKLKFGMCRVRVRAGVRERLLIQSIIALIGKDLYTV